MRRLPAVSCVALCAALLLAAAGGCASYSPSVEAAAPGTSNPNANPRERPSTEPGGDAAATRPDAPAFGDVQPLLTETFVRLMTEDKELDASSWRAFVDGSEYGPVVVPGDAEHSLLVAVAEHARATGQPGAPTEAELGRVRQWIEAGARSDSGERPFAGVAPRDRLYVANEAGSLVTIIDARENRVIGTVDLDDLGYGPNTKPHDVAVAPGGDYWYLSLISANRTLKFNTDNEVVGEIEMETPGLLKLDPETERLFIGRSMGAVDPPKSIGIVDGSETEEPRLVDVFFPRPHALGVDPSGQHAYVASLAQNQVAGIDAASGQMELTSMGGPVNTLVHFDVSPDGQTMVAGGQTSGMFFFFDLMPETPLAPTVSDSLQLDGQPWHPSYTPSGDRVYVPQKTANAISVVDTEARAVETTLRDGRIAQPHGSAVRPDGRYVYVASSNTRGTYASRYPDVFGDEKHGTVLVIDARTNEIVKVLPADQDPSGLDMAPPAGS